MPNRKKKIKGELWFGAIFASIIVFALLSSWWKDNPVLGWIILSVLLAITGYILYRYASLRGWLGRQVKETVQNVVFEKVASAREPLSQYERGEVFKRSQSRCENERCDFQGKPHIHHIDANNQHNNLGNLIALCPNCHQKAHDGIFTESQLINWARRDYKRLQTRKTRR